MHYLGCTRRLPFFFGLVLILGYLPVARAADFNPGCTGTTGDAAALRSAVVAANDNQSPDTITLVAGCTYNIMATLEVTDSNLLTVVGNGATIDGGFRARVFLVTGHLTLSDVTISHGIADTGNGVGGGIYNQKGTVTLNASRMIDNRAVQGGGAIFNELGGTVIGDGTTLFDNRTGRDSGGAIYNNGAIDFSQSVFSENVCFNAGHGGGAIFNNSGGAHGKITDSTFTGNRCPSASSLSCPCPGRPGGGAITNLGRLEIKRSTFSGNHVDNNGGAILNFGGRIELSESTLAGNVAGNQGGGVYNVGHLFMWNVTLSGNHAVTGGALYNAFYNAGFQQLVVDNSTLSANSATGAGAAMFGELHASIDIANSIIANPTSEAPCAGGGGVDEDSLKNLATVRGCGPSFAIGDPKLGPLADNGGPTDTHALLSGSAAINAGDNLACPSIDQRGFPRPRTDADPCDMGSFEVPDMFSCDSAAAVLGTAGNDTLTGTAAADVICGLEGNDTIDGGGGDDVIFGNAGNDTLSGLGGNDSLLGQPGNDTISGFEGDDVLRGHAGNDTLLGEEGSDSLIGHGGNDSLDGGPGSNSCVGGTGVDELLSC
jgi:Ca2+-binding RTX toxin-like protein